MVNNAAMEEDLDDSTDDETTPESSVNIVVSGRHTEVSRRFREHVIDKLSRIDRFGLQLRVVDVELSKESNPRLVDVAYEVELTCYGAGSVIRAEAASADKYSALDIAWGRLEQRLRRTADRARFHRHGKASMRVSDMPAALEPIIPDARGDDVDDNDPDGVHAAEVFASGPVVVREKVHDAIPMSVEQALTEMEMVGHDFFLFVDQANDLPSVVYRRRGYDYGLIRVGTGATAD